MADEDVMQLELTAEEKAIVSGGKEPEKTEVKEEVKPEQKEVKEEVKETKTETKAEDKESKTIDKIAEIFEIGKKKKVKEPENKEPLSEDERAEFETLKMEMLQSAEENAFKAELESMDSEILDVIKPTITALIEKDPEGNKFYDLLLQIPEITPEQRAACIVALAEKRHREDVEKVRAKLLEAKIDAAKKEAELKKEVKEVAGVKVATNQPPETPDEAARKTWAAAEAGDETALNKLLMGEDEAAAIKKIRG